MRLKEATRKNVHQTHLEDLVLLGVDGFNELNDKVEKFLRRFSSEEKELNLTQKIDGAPALFCWSKYPGYPDNSIALKGFATGPQNSMSSPEQIDAKYSDRPDMAAKLKLGLQLARYIPAGECWQGDCLFSKGDLREEEINGTNYLTFMPNKIVYAFSEDNADYNKVRNADFGIAFHTIYKDKNGEMTQGFDVDPTRLNDVPSNFYIMSPAISASRDVHDYDIEALNKEFNVLKSYENKLANNNAYNELINNASFMNYWNTFENATLADKKQVNINVGTFVQELKDYIKDKQTKEYNKKLSTLKTDQGRDKATAKFNSDVERLDNIVETNKSVLSDLVNALNAAANIKMLMWDGLRKSKNDYSTYYKSRTRGYIPAEGEGIAMSDMDGNIVKIVDRSTFSSYNRDPDIMSGFEHESLDLHEDLNPALKKALGDKEPEFKQLLKKLILDHSIYNNDIYPLGIYREDRDKGTNQELAHKFWLDKFGLDTSKRGISSAIAGAIMSASHEIEDSDEYKDTLDWDDSNRLPKDEQFKINLFYEWDAIRKDPFGEYSEDDPRKHMSFRQFLQDKLDSGDYDDDREEQLIIDAIEDVKGGSGYFREMLATQRGDMGKFNKKLILDEDGANHLVVLAFGRMNPPTIGHFKLIDKMASLAHGEKAKLYLSHTVNSKKDPLSYDSKVRWCKKAFGDKVNVVDSPAKNVFDVLADLYEDGYTDVIYVGGGDRIGGAEDISGSIMKYNGQKTKQGNVLYDFDSIRFENAGERNPDSDDPSEQASASLVRRLVIEDNFEEFKRYVPFNESDAKTLFKELKYAMLGKEESFLEECLFRENMLREAKLREAELKGDRLKKDPKLKNEFEKELDKIDPKLDVPDLDKGLDDYKTDPSGYQGLFVKQGSSKQVSFSNKDVRAYASQQLNKPGDEVASELKDLTVTDDKGTEYKLHDSGASLAKSGGGLSWNDKKEVTYYQEAIQMLLLTNTIRYEGDLIKYLSNSDRESGTGIFTQIYPYNKSKVKSNDLFKQYWTQFVDSYTQCFSTCLSESDKFNSAANGILESSGGLIPLHDGIKSEWHDDIEAVLSGADTVDKSDAYVVPSSSRSDISKILKEMVSLKGHPVEYVKFVSNANILGISLKKNEGSLSIEYDIPPITSNELSPEIYFTSSQNGSKIVFAMNDEDAFLDIRSANRSGGVMTEFRPKKGAAAFGKATTALKTVLGDNYAPFGKLFNSRQFRDATRYLVSLLTDEKDPVEMTPYKLSERGANIFASVFNFASGRPFSNEKGERITAPYIKVY